MDVTILQWITDVLQSPFLTSLMRFITALGNMGIIWVLFACYFWFVRKDRKTALALIAAVVLTWLFNDCVLKQIFQRPRPFITHPQFPPLITGPESSSFPSGHSATSFAAMAVLAVVGGKWKMTGILLAVLIAFSRVYLHVHYPTDVLAGSLVGLFIGSFLMVQIKKQKSKQ